MTACAARESAAGRKNLPRWHGPVLAALLAGEEPLTAARNALLQAQQGVQQTTTMVAKHGRAAIQRRALAHVCRSWRHGRATVDPGYFNFVQAICPSDGAVSKERNYVESGENQQSARHSCPSGGVLAKACAQYQSRIEMIYDGKVIKGKSIMSILGAGIKGRGSLEIICSGSDEQEAMEKLKVLFAKALASISPRIIRRNKRVHAFARTLCLMTLRLSGRQLAGRVRRNRHPASTRYSVMTSNSTSGFTSAS
jgi:phosphocarrier protein